MWDKIWRPVIQRLTLEPEELYVQWYRDLRTSEAHDEDNIEDSKKETCLRTEVVDLNKLTVCFLVSEKRNHTYHLISAHKKEGDIRLQDPLKEKMTLPLIPVNCVKTCTPTATRVLRTMAGVAHKSLNLRDRMSDSALMVSYISAYSAWAASASAPWSRWTTDLASSSLPTSRSHRLEVVIRIHYLIRATAIRLTGLFGKNWIPTKSSAAGSIWRPRHLKFRSWQDKVTSARPKGSLQLTSDPMNWHPYPTYARSEWKSNGTIKHPTQLATTKPMPSISCVRPTRNPRILGGAISVWKQGKKAVADSLKVLTLYKGTVIDL